MGLKLSNLYIYYFLNRNDRTKFKFVRKNTFSKANVKQINQNGSN